MKPTVISAANGNSSATPVGGETSANAVNIPINHEYSPHYANAESNASSSYGSPRQQQPHQHQQHSQPHSHQIPGHFQQGFGFEPDMDMDMDMFPRGRLGRMHHDPFTSFGTSHFGFPQFGSMGRRRMPASAADTMNDDDGFFNRLPNEFRQYIPEGFGQRRGGSAQMPQPTHHHQQQHHPYHGQNYVPGSTPPNSSYAATMQPPTPSKKVCDAAIQTEDLASSKDQVDHAVPNDSLNQHGLRNTVDMGIKTPPESDKHGPRAHSVPLPEQMQHNNGGRRVTPPQQSQFGTQTSPQTASGNAYQKVYYPPHQQPHPQQKQQTPPPSSQQQPQTPGGTYIRTIPIFVEGRTEPVINAHKEIPNQNAQQPPPSAKSHPPPQHQQHPHHQRPAPLNTQQPTPPQSGDDGVPPQTPHTMDSINKIQDIQRDVLELMGKVENFTGMRKDKEYVYLDEMLTRNLLKLDTIDTNGKDSIRLARKEAIKCIQASINVLEAKAEENAKTLKNSASGNDAQSTSSNKGNTSTDAAANEQDAATAITHQGDTASDLKSQEPIPLPPPSGEKGNHATNDASPIAPTEADPSATIETK